jgi:hypothetical protein
MSKINVNDLKRYNGYEGLFTVNYEHEANVLCRMFNNKDILYLFKINGPGIYKISENLCERICKIPMDVEKFRYELLIEHDCEQREKFNNANI